MGMKFKAKENLKHCFYLQIKNSEFYKRTKNESNKNKNK